MLVGAEPSNRGRVACAVLVVAIGIPTYDESRRVALLKIDAHDEGFDVLENWRMMDLEDDSCWDQKALRALDPGMYRVHAHFWFSTSVSMDGTEYDCGVRVAEVRPFAAVK